MVVFNNTIQQKNAFQMQVNYLHPLTFGITVPLFTEKFYGLEGRLFQQNSTFDHLIISSKNEIKEDNSKRCKT